MLPIKPPSLVNHKFNFKRKYNRGSQKMYAYGNIIWF